MKEISQIEMKNIQIDILKYIDKFCKENNIKYFVCGGTLIGAIRHNGFIPWDDDIDIIMPRPDYLKFIKIFNDNTNNEYYLLDNSIQPDYYYPFAKVIHTRTILKEKNFKEIKNYGIFVDVFSYNGLPNDEKKLNKVYKKYKNIQRIIFYTSFKKINENNIVKRIIKNIIRLYGKIVGYAYLINKINKLFDNYSLDFSRYAMSNWPIYSKKSEIQKTEDICDVNRHIFEGIEINIPKNYDNILKTTFGDYMKLPPKEKRVSNHSFIAYWRDDNEKIQ